jgi:predicted nucleotidyltransferase
MVTHSGLTESSVLFGKTRKAILALLFTHTDESFYLRRIVRLTGTGLGPAQRELNLLTEAGILSRTRDGNQVYFKANERNPIFNELKSIVVKTVGIADVIKSALKKISDRIDVAFIYGSFAKGTAGRTSDVDVMIIGDTTLREAVSLLKSAQSALGREINPSVMNRKECLKKLKSGNAFIRRVWDGEKTFLIGDENELKGLV